MFKKDSEVWPCNCSYCVSSFADVDGFRDINPTGPQKVYHSIPDGYEYLFLLNMDSEDFRARLKKASRLSSATFDIETMTSHLKGDLTSALRIEPVSEVAEDSDVHRAILQPILIGVASNIDDDDVKCDYAEFSLNSEETDERCMMFRFFDYVVAEQARMSALKKTVLKPIIDRLEAWRCAHFDFFVKHPEFKLSFKDQEATFKISLCGRSDISHYL